MDDHYEVQRYVWKSEGMEENIPSARIADTDCVRWTDPNNFHNFVH